MLGLYRAGRQAAALGVFDEARRVLGPELGVDPGPGLVALHRRILVHDPALDARAPREPPRARGSACRARRPALVGREEDRAAIGKLLHPGAVVTLTGPVGAGKTRLALGVAEDVAERFLGGRVVRRPLRDRRALPGSRATSPPWPGSRSSPGRGRSMP